MPHMIGKQNAPRGGRRIRGRWSREAPLQNEGGGKAMEIWTARMEREKPPRSYPVHVTLGKSLDVMALKDKSIRGFKGLVRDAHRTARLLIRKSGASSRAARCPVCRSVVHSDPDIGPICGGRYHACTRCGHRVLLNGPSGRELRRYYSQSAEYAAPLLDPSIERLRVEGIGSAKAAWVMDEFQRIYGRYPRTILDIGAGGGHFLEAARRRGLVVRGVEWNAVERSACHRSFGIRLEDADFTKQWRRFKGADVVTFWGVLEHVLDFMGLMSAARKLFGTEQGLVVAEVPRWDSLSTSVQEVYRETVVRHLDSIHVSVFSDESLASTFVRSGFAPSAAWYFGMDVYEMASQLAYRLRSPAIFRVLSRGIASMQNRVEAARFSDEIVLAGIPAEVRRR